MNLILDKSMRYFRKKYDDNVRCERIVPNIIAEKYHLFFNNNIISDIDECKTSNATNTCDSEASCTNTKGSYNCSCNRGYEGNGDNCSGKIRIFHNNHGFPFCTKMVLQIILLSCSF